ncbi:response regulator [Thalassospira xiamenensis]|uniref:response regulator n=1 Tax=Thalassospira xiamenensis TaxID=220697 RepID=UPI000DED5DBB|nr:response regulator [Thalassospira xiamenensis]RCK33936.1 response regulator [Thalassospira xiamenensis]
MNKVLFVDDNANILNGLRRRLRAACPSWTISFAASGDEALALCEQNSFDVVVSDMRMPGMDGAELLGHVRDRMPDAARIILSGFSEDEAILRTVGPAHQYLAKPCDDEILIETIQHTLKLRNILTAPELRKLVGNIDALASPPDTYTRLVQALENPKIGQERITAIVSSDIALTAEVLKLTNSAYFSLPAKITSISHAVRMIGTETLKSLALFVGLFKSFDGSVGVRRQIKNLCQRSQQIGVSAALIAEHEKLDKPTCQILPAIGMLSHIGSLVLYLNYPNQMEEAVARIESEKITIIEAEQKQFGAAHPEIGAYLLGLWGFPEQVVQAVAYHHRPFDFPHHRMSGLTAIYAAQLLSREVASQGYDVEGDIETKIDIPYLTRVGKADRIPVWRDIVATVLKSYERMDH